MASLQRVLIGYFLAAVVGIGVGILIGLNSFANQALDPLFQFLRTVPPSSVGFPCPRRLPAKPTRRSFRYLYHGGLADLD
jgi:ABC-type anion transport system duplicated permease subunit